MLSISLDQHREGGIYRMCVLAARRAQDLSRGALPLIAKPKGCKVTTQALTEVLAGVVEEGQGHIDQYYDEDADA